MPGTVLGTENTVISKTFSLWSSGPLGGDNYSGDDKNQYQDFGAVVQWLRIHLPMQGTQVRALVQEDPTCGGATKPVGHNY